MSDNPADSLRRELEAQSWPQFDYEANGNRKVVRLSDALAALEAARADARAQAFTEAADMLEASGGIIGCARAIDPVLIDLQVVAHNPVQGEAMHKVIGYTAVCYCAGLVRGLAEDGERVSDDEKGNA